MAKRREPPTDPIRALIWNRSQELRIPLKEISRLTERNETYLHQFVHKGSPRDLPEDVRAIVAKELDIPEDKLKSSAVARRTPIGNYQITPRRTLPAPPANSVPVFAIGETVAPDAAQDWVERPGPYAGAGASFALYIRGRNGRLMAGDMVFVLPNAAVRIGDYTVILENNVISAVGEVTAADDRNTTVKTHNKEMVYTHSSFKALKISALVFP